MGGTVGSPTWIQPLSVPTINCTIKVCPSICGDLKALRSATAATAAEKEGCHDREPRRSIIVCSASEIVVEIVALILFGML